MTQCRDNGIFGDAGEKIVMVKKSRPVIFDFSTLNTTADNCY